MREKLKRLFYKSCLGAMAFGAIMALVSLSPVASAERAVPDIEVYVKNNLCVVAYRDGEARLVPFDTVPCSEEVLRQAKR